MRLAGDKNRGFISKFRRMKTRRRGDRIDGDRPWSRRKRVAHKFGRCLHRARWGRRGRKRSDTKIHKSRMGLKGRLRAAISLSYYTGILLVVRSPGFILFSASSFTTLFFLFVVGGGSDLPYGEVGATISILVQVGSVTWDRRDLQ